MLWMILVLPCVFGVKQVCPGGGQQCPDSATCCELSDKSYGCCPMSEAVCCADHIHCCPKTTRCSGGMCISAADTMNAAHRLGDRNTTCAGGKFVCPEDTTCCGGGAQHGCCPLVDAVCCADNEHCCPQDTVCDLDARKCVDRSTASQMYGVRRSRPIPRVPKLKKVKQASGKFYNVICPGSSFQCPNGYTCCRMPTGKWGCCPFEKGSCCRDGLHCCPEGMTCDATSQYCSQGLQNLTSVHVKIAAPIENVVCPDKRVCSDDQTCCSTGNSRYGCCGYYNATCCADRVHCCPENFDCEVEQQRCVPRKGWVGNVINF